MLPIQGDIINSSTGDLILHTAPVHHFQYELEVYYNTSYKNTAIIFSFCGVLMIPVFFYLL